MSDGFPHILVATFVFLSPFSSAMRAINLNFGNILLSICDTIIFILFFISILRGNREKYFCLFLVFIIFYTLIFHFQFSEAQGFSVFYLGFRKAMLFPIAIFIGHSLEFRQLEVLLKYSIISLTVICLNGIRQHFYFTELDHQLLSVQGSDIYTKVIGGNVRSFSFLSSGFHLGMAGFALLSMSLFRRKISIVDILIASIALFAVYASMTRTMLVICGIAILYRFLFLNFKNGILVILATVPMSLLVLYLFRIDIINSISSRVMNDDRFTNRFESYQNFSTFASHHPDYFVGGFGIGSAGSTLGTYFPHGYWIEPHNLFLKYIFELGPIFGTVMIFFIFRNFFKKPKLASGEIFIKFKLGKILMIGMAVSGLTITSVETWPINILIGLIFGSTIRINNDLHNGFKK